MKKLALAALSAAALAASPAAAAGHSWTGFYVGVNTGYAWTNNSIIDVDGDQDDNGTKTRYRDHSGALGGMLGANWQFGRFVLGAEGGISYSGIESSTDRVDADTRDATAITRVDWFGTLRGRAGVALDNILLYGTGGVAFAGIHSKLTDLDGGVVDPDDSFSSRAVRVGWVAGGGAEVAASANWAVRLEALYMDFGRRTVLNGDADRFVLADRVGVVRLGVTYRFGGIGF